jgi:hypothetical protein
MITFGAGEDGPAMVAAASRKDITAVATTLSFSVGKTFRERASTGAVS